MALKCSEQKQGGYRTLEKKHKGQQCWFKHKIVRRIRRRKGKIHLMKLWSFPTVIPLQLLLLHQKCIQRKRPISIFLVLSENNFMLYVFKNTWNNALYIWANTFKDRHRLFDCEVSYPVLKSAEHSIGPPGVCRKHWLLSTFKWQAFVLCNMPKYGFQDNLIPWGSFRCHLCSIDFILTCKICLHNIKSKSDWVLALNTLLFRR